MSSPGLVLLDGFSLGKFSGSSRLFVLFEDFVVFLVPYNPRKLPMFVPSREPQDVLWCCLLLLLFLLTGGILFLDYFFILLVLHSGSLRPWSPPPALNFSLVTYFCPLTYSCLPFPGFSVTSLFYFAANATVLPRSFFTQRCFLLALYFHILAHFWVR